MNDGFKIIFCDLERAVIIPVGHVYYVIDPGNYKHKKLKEVVGWLKENKIKYSIEPYATYRKLFRFSSDEDYVAFKLRWS